MLKRGVDPRHASSCKRPIRGYLQAEPGMPRVIDLQLGIMCFELRGCTMESGCIRLSTTKLRRRFTVSQLGKGAAAIHLIFAEFLSGHWGVPHLT